MFENMQELSAPVRWVVFIYALFALTNVGLIFESRLVKCNCQLLL